MPVAERRIVAGRETVAGGTVLYRALLLLSLAALLTVGVAGASAAAPGLGPRGWAPGTVGVHLSAAVVTGMLWPAYLLGAGAVGWGLLRPTVRVPHPHWTMALGVAALLSCPFGSADHTNYAAYGRIAAQGGDPYLVPPVTWAGGHDPVAGAVEPPWTMTPSIYGPFATALQAGASLAGGDNLRQTVWVWQLLVVAAWLSVRAILLRVATDGHERRRVDLLWTWNPVLFGVAVLGAHVDVLACALALAALLLAPRAAPAAGAVLGLVVSTKVTYAVVGLAVLWSWRGLGRRDGVRRATALVLGSVAVALPLHLWAGPHVFDQLLRVRRSVSLATPWRVAVELLTGPLPSSTVRTLVSVAAVVVTAALAAALALVVAAAGRAAVLPWSSAALLDGPGRSELTASLRATFVLGTAYAIGAPYSLPWYDTLTWATLPLVAATALDGVLLARFTVMALAYVPGRVVGLTPGVQDLTLGIRREVAPYAGLLAWALIASIARRAWERPSSASRIPRGSPGPSRDGRPSRDALAPGAGWPVRRRGRPRPRVPGR